MQSLSPRESQALECSGIEKKPFQLVISKCKLRLKTHISVSVVALGIQTIRINAYLVIAFSGM